MGLFPLSSVFFWNQCDITVLRVFPILIVLLVQMQIYISMCKFILHKPRLPKWNSFLLSLQIKAYIITFKWFYYTKFFYFKTCKKKSPFLCFLRDNDTINSFKEFLWLYCWLHLNRGISLHWRCMCHPA